MNTKLIGNTVLSLVSMSVPIIRGIGEDMLVFGILASVFNFVFTFISWNLLPDDFWRKINQPLGINKEKIVFYPFLIVYLVIVVISFDLFRLVSIILFG